MTLSEMTYMHKCVYHMLCNHHVLMHASTYADPYHWLMCGSCSYRETDPKCEMSVATIHRLLAEIHDLREENDRLHKHGIEVGE